MDWDKLNKLIDSGHDVLITRNGSAAVVEVVKRGSTLRRSERRIAKARASTAANALTRGIEEA